MPFNIGPGELILILLIALVVLGPGKLPDVASSLGKSLREFRRAATDITDAGKLDASTTTSTAQSAPTAAAAPAQPAPPAPPSEAPPPSESASAPAPEPARDQNPS